MASRISQMRNVVQEQQPNPQQQLNESIEATRNLMHQMEHMSNPETMINYLLQIRPELSSILPLLRNGGNLKNIAQQMAQMKGINPNFLLSQLLK